MANKITQEFHKFSRLCYQLKRILKETHNTFNDISFKEIFPQDDLLNKLQNELLLKKLSKINEYPPTLVILGQSCPVKAYFVNTLLGHNLLPNDSHGWRWIRIVYNRSKINKISVSLELNLFEVVNTSNEEWLTIDNEYIKRTDQEIRENTIPFLEIKIAHNFMKENAFQILIPPDCDNLQNLFLKPLASDDFKILPIFIFLFSKEFLDIQDLNILRSIKRSFPVTPLCFIYINNDPRNSESTSFSQKEQLTKSEHLQELTSNQLPNFNVFKNHSKNKHFDKNLIGLIHQLATLEYLNLDETGSSNKIEQAYKQDSFGSYLHTSCFLDDPINLDGIVNFIKESLKVYLLQATTMMNQLISKCLREFILSAFDMAREIQITPKRIGYAQSKEAELYKNLMSLPNEKQEEIQHLIETTLREMKDELVENAAEYRYNGVALNNEDCSHAVKVATDEIQQLLLRRLSRSVAGHLVKSADCLKDTYVGTLQRCLESLEKNCHEQDASLLASDAVKQILTAAYNIQLSTSGSSSIFYEILERIRKLFVGFLLPWASTPNLDADWRKKVARDMLDSLSSVRLAKSICSQFRERVKSSHDSFQSAMRSLENHYSGRLEQTEEQRITIRKLHAPRLARLTLEITSLGDVVQYGMPKQNKEIGRGQYGVVFACESWAGPGPCAVKSVIPPDDKHWNDLAMEFYYTRSIPDHKHVVRVRGSVIDYTYPGGCSAVLLIMDRLSRDLHTGIRIGLSWTVRLQIAIDVAEGIRYLHSQGLVHRDIKLKNVLLDCDNHAKLTDLGFCIPEAMMSGSIVGTPVHMAPELLSGHYDSSVDVYAFGILFWYICAGHVKLPYIFEQFQNKEQLWSSVKKGTRPEKLEHFEEKCWSLMKQCWSGEPHKRPLLGSVLSILEEIRNELTIKLNIYSINIQP